MTSLSCTDGEPLFQGSDIIVYSSYTVTGTVSGPVGTTLSGSLDSTSAWSGLERGPSDPATTEWQGVGIAGAIGGDILSFFIWAVSPNGGNEIFNFTDSCPG